jgi:hypothetical protein
MLTEALEEEPESSSWLLLKMQRRDMITVEEVAHKQASRMAEEAGFEKRSRKRGR